MSTARPSAEEIKRQLSQPLFKSGKPLLRLTDPIADTPMVVKLDDLHPYEHNPRHTRNPLYDEIKASIRARGLDQPPTITRRPEQDFYIIRNGGNTRLAVLNELWKETGDRQFYNIPCLFKPWQNEAQVLVGHLAENELRGELTFLERAQAVTRMKLLYEEADEQGNPRKPPLSLRELSKRLTQDGYPLSHQRIARLMDCLGSLLPALPNALQKGLGNRKIEVLLKLKSELSIIWEKYDKVNAFTALWLSVLAGFDGEPDHLPSRIGEGTIEDKMLGGMGDVLGVPFADLKMDLFVLRNQQGKPPAGQAREERSAPDEAAKPLAGAAAAPLAGTPASVPAHPLSATATQNDAPLPANTASAPVPQPATKPQAGHSEALSAEQRKALLEAHTVSPLQTHTRARAIEKQLTQAEGVQRPDFDETVPKAIPVMAGGGLCEVTDVWFIAEDLDMPDALREQIGLLAQDIARFGAVKGLISTDDGLGFSCQRLTHDGSARACSAALLLSMVLGEVQESCAIPEQGISPLFSQALIGSPALQDDAPETASIRLQRLPDDLLVKWFRLIRLARRLMDLQHL